MEKLSIKKAHWRCPAKFLSNELSKTLSMQIIGFCHFKPIGLIGFYRDEL